MDVELQWLYKPESIWIDAKENATAYAQDNIGDFGENSTKVNGRPKSTARLWSIERNHPIAVGVAWCGTSLGSMIVPVSNKN